MERRRTIAGSPVRSAEDTWAALTELIVATVAASPTVDAADAQAECEAAAPAMTVAIAAGRMDEDRLTLVAGPVYAHLYIATGAEAFDAQVDERLDAVVGGTTATDWCLYVDPPDLASSSVKAGLAGSTHLVVGQAPAHSSESDRSASASIDLGAFKRIEIS